MRIVEINTVYYGSTGKIMFQIADKAREKQYEVYTFSMKWRRQPKPQKGHSYYGTFVGNELHKVVGTLTGTNGMHTTLGTFVLLRELHRIKPNIIHLHNLHNFCINLPLLFNYIKTHNIQVVWTLHDCWSFTGQCPHFTAIKCNRWKTGCHHCPQINVYPKSYIDNTKNMWKLKRKWFTGIKDMTIVTPSQWLADLVKQSYLKDYPVQVINNGIDLSIFKPTESNFREKYNIPKDKYILLGVAFGWGKRKGLDVFIELSKRLDPSYQIVLVGTDDNVDKQLPANIISIHRTQNQAELAEIYSAADLFVQTTREENFPTVNMESIACATPVLTFRTGGSPEMLDGTCGMVVDCDDINALEKDIIRISIDKPFSSEDCIARAKMFDMNDKFMEYVRLYENFASMS